MLKEIYPVAFMASSVILKSTTLEGQFLELVLLIQAYQINTATNPNARNLITGPLQINAQTGIASFSASIPATAAIDTDGSVDTTAVEVYVDPV